MVSRVVYKHSLENKKTTLECDYHGIGGGFDVCVRRGDRVSVAGAE